jgi:hypothetical protein
MKRRALTSLVFCAAIVTASGCSQKDPASIEQPPVTTSSAVHTTGAPLSLPSNTELPDEPVTLPSLPTDFTYRHLEEDDKGWSCLFASDAMGMLCEL